MHTRTEPVIVGGIAAAVLAFVAATIALLVAFGVDVTEDQRNAILGWVTAVIGLVGILAPLAAALWARRKVTPLVNPRLVTPAGAVIPLVPSTEVAVDDPPRHRAGDAGCSALDLAVLVFVVLAIVAVLLAITGRL